MADAYKKISDFTKASEFGDNDLLLVSQTGTTRALRGVTLKEFAKAAGIEAAKINNAVVNASGHLIFTTTDGASFDAGKVDGEDGVSVTGASIDSQYHLILTFSDGSTKDAGYCRGASGAGTGDMLEETYDASGAVKAAGGIVAYTDSRLEDIDAVMDVETYDPYNEVANDGGIAGYLKLHAEDIVEPIGTIKTSAKISLGDAWVECDGSELDCQSTPEIWHILRLKNGEEFPELEKIQTVASGLSEISATEPCWLKTSDGYYYYMAVSGMSGSDAVLNIYKSDSDIPDMSYESGYQLVKSYTVAGKDAGKYPCVAAMSGRTQLIIAWAIDDSVRLYSTTDGNEWTETQIATEESVMGHKLDFGKPSYGAWHICDCSNGAVYSSDTPTDAESWTKIPEPEELSGYVTTSARMSVVRSGLVAVVRAVFDSDGKCMVVTHTVSGSSWDLLGDYVQYYSFTKRDIPLSKVVYFRYNYYYAMAEEDDSEFRHLVLRRMDNHNNEWVATPRRTDVGTEFASIELESGHLLALSYTTTDSSTDGHEVMACGDIESEFFTCGTSGGYAPEMLFCPGAKIGVINENGELWGYDFRNATINLPNISLSDNTTTFIKIDKTTYWG